MDTNPTPVNDPTRTGEQQDALAPYEPPRLQRLGAVADVTRSRSMIGMMDGGGGANRRTG